MTIYIYVYILNELECFSCSPSLPETPLAMCRGPPWSYSFLSVSSLCKDLPAAASVLACRAQKQHALSAEEGSGSAQSTVDTPRSMKGTVNDSLLASVLLVQVAARHISP